MVLITMNIFEVSMNLITLVHKLQAFLDSVKLHPNNYNDTSLYHIIYLNYFRVRKLPPESHYSQNFFLLC